MRRRKRRLELHTVSLFPFLAVLICTFGVLIILLVIVVKAAEVAATESEESRQAENQQKIEAVQHELDLQLLRVEGLTSIRPALLKELQQEKNRRAHLQADINKLTDELEMLNRQFDLLSEPTQQLDHDKSDVEIDALQQQLTDDKDLLEKRRQAVTTNKATKYSIVPYDGPGGTKRKPVYIECRQSEIILQPYAIRLGSADFVAPILPNNPLDAALIAVREYFIKNDLGDENGAPYPLLIVRPDGPNAYSLARHAMRSWDEEFGYELIPADKDLDFGKVDEQLKQEIMVAVSAAKRRQQEYLIDQQLSRARRQTHSGTVADVQNAGGLHASSQFGGFVSSDGRTRKASGEDILDSKTENIGEPGETISNAKRAADIAVTGVQAEGKNIAHDRGKDWALPSNSKGAVAYRRPVKIFLTENQVVMAADSRSNRMVTINIEDNPSSSVESLVEAIWQRIDTWGVAGVGGYWKPELDVVVLPGAESRFRQFNEQLQDSGIAIKENQQ